MSKLNQEFTYANSAKELADRYNKMYEKELKQINELVKEGYLHYPVGITYPVKRNVNEIKDKFKSLMVQSGIKNVLSLTDRLKHEIELGTIEEYATLVDSNTPKRFCGVCGDPMCPYSD